MITTHINPPNIQSEYLHNLNLVLSDWGNADKYAWYFQRKTSFPDPDLMILKNGEQTLAGSAVSYRQLRFPNGGEVLIGIMTGSWTLPEARGQGCFGHIIQESIRLTSQKGGALLIAFVTEDNASFRQLAKAGATLVPSTYIFSTPETPTPNYADPLKIVIKNKETAQILLERLNTRYQKRLHFSYPTQEDFIANFCERPLPTEVWQDAAGNFSVIETKPDTYLLQLWTANDDEQSLTNILRHTIDLKRKFFMFSTRPEITTCAEHLGLSSKLGYITILPADATKSPLISDAATPWYENKSLLEDWDVQSGDRT